MILHDKQREIVRNQNRFKVIRSGRRSGKTTLEVEDMIFSAVSQKNRNIFYIAPTQIQAREIIWEMFRKRLNGIGDFNEQRLEIKVPTQDGGVSMIKLAGWENRENFRGKGAFKIVFDEVDTMKDFFLGWQEIFRPTLMDTGGNAVFIGTPKKENPNLRRLEKIAEKDLDYKCFHFTSLDNPFLPEIEKQKSKEEMDLNSYKQEILAEYIFSSGSLFKYEALVDIFSNSIVKRADKYLIVDIADDGLDSTIFSFWEGLEEYRREEFEKLNTELIIEKIREFARNEKIPYSHICVDAIGVGAGVASSSLLDGIIGFKSSYAPIKTDESIVVLPNINQISRSVLTSDFVNLRSQCIFELANLVNNHKISSKITGIYKEKIIEELFTYQDVSVGDGKRMATKKEVVKELIGHSPDHSDCFIMRCFFVIKEKMLTNQDPEYRNIIQSQISQFSRNKKRLVMNNNQ